VIASGSAATAQEAAVTKKTPVAIAAAGRSQPNQPARAGSGAKRSATASPKLAQKAKIT
jgi:subtilisin family serine protease